MKTAFLLKNNWIEIFDNLSDKQAGVLIKSLFKYNVNGEKPTDLTDIEVKAYFNMMLLDCKTMNDNYDRRCITSAENGQLGGRPRKDEKPKKPNSKPKKPKNLSKPDNDNECDVKRDDLFSETPKGVSVSNGKPIDEANQPPLENENINYQKLIEWFNDKTKGIFGEVKYPISKIRKSHIKARIREHGKQSFAEMVQIAVNSDFLKGQNQRGFKATFDWLIKPTNFEKVLSGNYVNKEKPNDN